MCGGEAMGDPCLNGNWGGLGPGEAGMGTGHNRDIKECFPAVLTGHQHVPEAGPGLWSTGGAQCQTVPEGTTRSGGWGGSWALWIPTGSMRQRH